VSIDEKLEERLKLHAAATKKPPEDLIADCVSIHLDSAARFRFLLERMDLVDQGLIDIASFVGDVAAEAGQSQPASDRSPLP
jgi:hypothetical protein